jgi:phage tail-like protein
MSTMMRAILPMTSYPDVSYNFVVMLGLRPFGDFAEVSGVEYTIEPFEYAEMGRNHSARYFAFDKPGKRGELTMKSGAVVKNTLYEWIYLVRSGGAFRRDVFVLQLTRDGDISRITRFGKCWPKVWKGPELKTSESAWALEELTIVYENYEMVLPKSFQFYI